MRLSALVAAVSALSLLACDPGPGGNDGGETPAPETSIVSAPAALVASASATFTFSSDVAGATFRCAWDGEAEAACTSPATRDGLAEGEHTFSVRASHDGKTDDTPATHGWTVDLTAPETTIVGGPPARTNQSSAEIAFEADGPATFECRTGAEAFAPCSSPLALSGLPDGDVEVQIRALDSAGNVEATPAQVAWTVDLTAPETTLTAGPPPFTGDTSAELAFTSNEQVARFECRLSPASDFEDCTSPVVLTSLSEGSYSFEVRAVDLVAWEDPTPATITWTVDTTPPDTAVLSSPASPHQEASATVTFSSADGDATFECRVDPQPFEACASPHTVTGLTDGQSVLFHVRAIDPAGNVDPTPATASWSVDLLPDTFITNSPPTEQTETSITFAFESDDPAAVFDCTIDGFTAPCTSPVTYSNLDLGEHTFSVVALDALLQPDPTPATWSFRIVPPEVRIRIMASNLSSGNGQDYDLGHGIRIMQGVKADIIAVQEFDYLSSNATNLRAMVDQVCGTECQYFRENDGTDSLPNGIISRYPILQSGEWTQFNNQNGGSNRDYVWARIDIPGPVDLWVISVHLHSGSSSNRAAEANELVSNVNAFIPAGDYVALAGDFNTDTRSENAINNLSSVFNVSAPYPVDQNGNGNTNASRAKPYDWVVANAALHARRTPVEIGASLFTNGAVIDTRVYTPLADLAPAEFGDSGAVNMQHMGVVRDFLIPVN